MSTPGRRSVDSGGWFDSRVLESEACFGSVGEPELVCAVTRALQIRQTPIPKRKVYFTKDSTPTFRSNVAFYAHHASGGANTRQMSDALRPFPTSRCAKGIHHKSGCPQTLK